MNILMLTSNDIGGITQHIVVLGKKLMDQDAENNVIVGCESGEIEEIMKSNFPTYVLDFHSINPITIIKTFFSLKKIIIENDIDIVHCHYRTNSLYMHILSKFLKIKFVWTNHLLPINHDFIHRNTTFYGKKAIAIGKESRDFIVNCLKKPADDVEIIYHGVDTDEFDYKNTKSISKESLGIGDSRVVVLLGRLDPVKGHRFLIDSTRDIDNITLVFTGSGDEKYKNELENYIIDTNFDKKVIFTGHVKSKDILGIADVMVLPSIKEGFGISVLESFAMKVPVVRTKTAGYEDTKELCFGVDYGNTGMLRDAILKALDKNTTQPMIDKAYSKIQNEWNVDEMAKSYQKLYRECIFNEKLG